MTRLAITDADRASVALDEAKGELGDRYMVAYWRITDGGLMQLRRVTWQFPVGRFQEAVELLKNDCRQEAGTPVERPPLPRATIFPDRLGIVSKEENGDA